MKIYYRNSKVSNWIVLFFTPIFFSLLISYALYFNPPTRQKEVPQNEKRQKIVESRLISQSPKINQAVFIPIQLQQTFTSSFQNSQNQVFISSSLEDKKILPQPRQEMALANKTNYGDRYVNDALGHVIHNELLVVLHETVMPAKAAVKLFQTSHLNDNDQASYHTIIDSEGTIIYIVPPDKRAFGAGNSVFMNASGSESVQTNPKLNSSVNNFSYHISLETPLDGRNEIGVHSGYTDVQYQALAWLIKKTGVKNDRITTHYAVDRTGKRKDPRSFDFKKFFILLNNEM